MVTANIYCQLKEFIETISLTRSTTFANSFLLSNHTGNNFTYKNEQILHIKKSKLETSKRKFRLSYFFIFLDILGTEAWICYGESVHKNQSILRSNSWNVMLSKQFLLLLKDWNNSSNYWSLNFLCNKSLLQKVQKYTE